MATAEATTSTSRRLKGDRELKQQLQILCRTDNWTNWLYLLRAYAIIAASIGGTIWLYYWLLSAGLSVWWAAPAALAAIMVIGASQHQLAGATHEATHHTLFKGRMLNELVSDWLCMFPVFSTTYSFRLYHLIHHQFVNDPDHDPDFVVLAKSGHWLDFPVSAAKFLGMLAKQALILPLLRYILVRFRFNAVGVDMANAYKRKEKSSKLPERIGFLWLAGLLLMQVGLTYYGDWRLAAAIPPVYWVLLAVVFFVLPERHFAGARLKPVVPRRYLATCRLFFMMTLFTSLTVAQMLSGQPIWWFFFVLWGVPLLTSFPFFMILRQVVQHGNGDRGWLTNTRTFLVNPLVKYAVFPFGMDYHLGHHMYATVPHYNLPKLHEFMLQFPEYAEQGLEVKNYLLPEHRQPRRPTVVEVLGPEYAMHTDDVYIDNTVLDDWEVDEKDEILRETQGK
ncbi:MAG: fatty acid desaturase [Planctomycetales bacterium]|nr:fatty acid desaturase [Planctomycetales bacterium]